MDRNEGAATALVWARTILGLGERASIEEVRDAYRKLAKKNHPDVVGTAGGVRESGLSMSEITEAYATVLNYCQRYPIPLDGTEPQPDDDVNWWFDRFGHDPVWGR